MENIYSTIGQRIYDLRIEHDVQQGELSKAIGLHQSVLNRIEKGNRPARDTEIISISRYFNVCTDYLLGITQQKNYQPIDTASANYDDSNIHDDAIEDTQQDQRPETSPPAYTSRTANVTHLSSHWALDKTETDLINKFRALDKRGKIAVMDTATREYGYAFSERAIVSS
ncbi:MAG: helix-turn-helix domain-containing protein [Selenomonadaceae bacterium]|nr:helix-turn-helix domain-containing protein [Selenomonadaceae bacterium]